MRRLLDRLAVCFVLAIVSCTDTEREEFGDEHIGSDSPEEAPPVLDSAVPRDRLSVLGSAEWVDWELIYIFYFLKKAGHTGGKNGM